MSGEFGIVDLFAGPGGLAEGFSSIRDRNGRRPFRLALSIEKEHSAFATLRLRSFLRQFEKFPREYYRFLNDEIPEPDWAALYPEEWKAACAETAQLELGSRRAADEIDARLTRIKRRYGDNVILIGGPPCQAYSLVGRARNKGTEGYEARRDPRHFLYREYIRILERLMPAAFVMENVKGLLSSAVDGVRIFDRVLDDLSRVGHGAYTLVPLSPRSEKATRADEGHPPATDFIVAAEDHHVPQARHRVIIVGIRSDIVDAVDPSLLGKLVLRRSENRVAVQDVIQGMPKLRSGLSRGDDDEMSWKRTLLEQMRVVARADVKLPTEQLKLFRALARRQIDSIQHAQRLSPRSRSGYGGMPAGCPDDLRRWLADPSLTRCPNHETRGHMPSDLARYFFAALYGKITGISPKASDFPRELAPDHRNWKSGKFADRFRVQVGQSPATTITSHIAKDGHYFIHPDVQQCRSLTVREAARLQTFPDNYFFKGNRTQQYVQVGNAVPPYLARRIAKGLHQLLSAAQLVSAGSGAKKAS